MLTGLSTFGIQEPQNYKKKMHVFNDEFFLFQFSKQMIARLFFTELYVPYENAK